MKKQSFIFLFIIILPMSIWAQVDDIKKHSRSSKSNKSSISSADSGSSADSFGDAVIESCAQSCFEVFAYILIEGLISHHQYLMEQRDEDPTVLALSIQPNFTYNPTYEGLSISPELSGNWGVLSTSFSLHYLMDFDNISADIYKIYEWQILQLNIKPVKEFHIRIGSGLYHENFTDTIVTNGVTSSTRFKQTYNEHYAGLYVYLRDFKYIGSLDYRWAMNYEDEKNMNVLQEVNLSLSRRFIHSNHLDMYVTGGGRYQNFYSSVHLFSILGGIRINIH